MISSGAAIYNIRDSKEFKKRTDKFIENIVLFNEKTEKDGIVGGGKVLYESGKERSDDMDDYLKAYIEKVDRDQSDLKHDFRESEKRLENHINKSEERMDAQLGRIEELIKEQGHKVDDLKETIDAKIGENKKFMWGITITIILSIIASIGVIISTYLSTISLIKSMI